MFLESVTHPGLGRRRESSQYHAECENQQRDDCPLEGEGWTASTSRPEGRGLRVGPNHSVATARASDLRPHAVFVDV
jgi:hypothetical protein